MVTRYEEVTKDVLNMAEIIINEHFPELREMGIKIKYLFDTKERRSQGKIVLGSCVRSNEIIRHLTKTEANDIEGFPYVIILDRVAWDNIDEKDQIRILRHEIRHIATDGEKFRLNPHDIEDFSLEIQLNQDDIRWNNRVALLVANIYEQQKEEM